jgi:hypothetical protein
VSPLHVGYTLDLYQRRIHEELGQHPTDAELLHLAGMIPEMRFFPDVEKQMRWLGFIQGVLWHRKLYTLDELRAHCRQELL